MKRNYDDDDDKNEEESFIRAPDDVFRDRLIDDHVFINKKTTNRAEEDIINESIIEHEIQTLFDLLDKNQITQEEFNQLYGVYLEDQSPTYDDNNINNINNINNQDDHYLEAAIKASKEEDVKSRESFYTNRDGQGQEFITYLQRIKLIDRLSNSILELYLTSIIHGNQVLIPTKRYDQMIDMIEFILNKTIVSKKIKDDTIKMKILFDFKEFVKPIYDLQQPAEEA